MTNRISLRDVWLAWLIVAGFMCLILAQPSQASLRIDDSKRLPDTCYGVRPDGARIDTVVLHFISAENVLPSTPYDLEGILNILRGDSTKEMPPLSSHYLIDRSGTIYRLVPDHKRAWHAGYSKMPAPDNREKVNDFSLGIELMGTANDPITRQQYQSLAGLIDELKKRHRAIRNDRIVGHDMIRALWNIAHPDQKAPAKIDPGPLFHWSYLFSLLGKTS